MARIHPTWELETRLVSRGAPVVFGFDEVGRGSLAGPTMVGCAAILSSRLRPAAPEIPDHLVDSKMLTENEREKLFDPLKEFVDGWAVGSASNAEIDQFGITSALGMAAIRALAGCESMLVAEGKCDEDALAGAAGILDGPTDYITAAAGMLGVPDVPVLPAITTKVRGDSACAIVSAASDLAKVTRDRLMERLAKDPRYAPYGWASNKGYGTKAHRDAIRRLGPSDLHRRTWHLV